VKKYYRLIDLRRNNIFRNIRSNIAKLINAKENYSSGEYNLSKTENPVTVGLRITTIDIIQKLHDTGITFKAAALRVYKLTRKKQTATGFPVASFMSFYHSYNKYKYKYKEYLTDEVQP
jgi:hypothetical protein